MSPIILYQHLFLNLQLLNLLLWEIVNLNLNLLTEKKNIYIYIIYLYLTYEYQIII